MTRRVVLVAAAALAAALPLAACGGGEDGGSGPLRWAGEPTLFTPENLPHDRIVTGWVRNASVERLKIRAMPQIRVVDADGDELRSAAIFSRTYGHQLFPPTREPGRISEAERARVGQLGVLTPGRRLPVTVSWTEAPGQQPAARIEYPGGALALPPRG